MKPTLKKPVHFVFEDDIELQDYDNETFSIHCYDGFAVATSNSDNRVIKLKYPKMAEITPEQKNDILSYRGFGKDEEITFGDVMMLFGKEQVKK